MVIRRERIRVVLDTNVLVRNFRSKDPLSPNKKVFQLWFLRRRLQMILSAALIDEYLEVLEEKVQRSPRAIAKWRYYFEHDTLCTTVRLGRRFKESRDPDDNLLLATAHAGRADYLITNDRDLLDLPASFQRAMPFRILTPQSFLIEIGEA